jgi:hypothetical protein
MATSLPGDLPEGLAGVKTRPLFVMRLNVRPLEIIGPAVGPVRRVGVVFGGVSMESAFQARSEMGATIGRRFAATAPSP